MNWSELPLNPSPRTLRQFAGMWLALFAALAGWNLFFQQQWLAGVLFAILSLGIGLAGLWKPAFVRPIYVGGVVAGFPIGWLLSRVALAAVFYLVVTPLALCSRLLGRDPLLLRRKAREGTNWSPLAGPDEVRRYFRQY